MSYPSGNIKPIHMILLLYIYTYAYIGMETQEIKALDQTSSFLIFSTSTSACTRYQLIRCESGDAAVINIFPQLINESPREMPLMKGTSSEGVTAGFGNEILGFREPR
ncbi:hypothetical protein CDAR_471151 [Caerostris darwini]|uniref:Uncharacterized protein n=1 Tax=Caerostris darwini TaxID=1538125 RepID=A0AAV4QJJ0_9ARAC|nr:hypothetical protein CDAR_471151 [Caerostris darwini]